MLSSCGTRSVPVAHSALWRRTGDFIAAKIQRPLSLIHPDVKKHVSVAFIAIVINMQER